MIIQGSLTEYTVVVKRSKFRFHPTIGLTPCCWFWRTGGKKRKLFDQYNFIFSNDYIFFFLKSFIYFRSFYSGKKQFDVVQNSQWQLRYSVLQTLLGNPAPLFHSNWNTTHGQMNKEASWVLQCSSAQVTSENFWRKAYVSHVCFLFTPDP